MQFAEIIRSKVDAKGWSMKRFGDEIGRTPEHARKIYHGRAFPADDLIPRIAEKLQADQVELQEQLAEARWEKRYKKKAPQPVRSDFGPLDGVWELLDSEQREYVACVANCLVMRKQRKSQ